MNFAVNTMAGGFALGIFVWFTVWGVHKGMNFLKNIVS